MVILRGVTMVKTRPSMFSTHKNSSLFGSVTELSSRGEIDLRAEMDCILFGSPTSPPKGYPMVIRRMRRNVKGIPIPCECKHKFSNEPDPDCSYCFGEGDLADEEWFIGRSEYVGSDGGLGNRFRIFPAGEIRADAKLFFFRYDTPIVYGDKIVEMKLDNDGRPVVPYVREAIHKPQTVNRLRGDYGRVEYIACYVLENDAIRSDNE